jgi:lipopolysaccharide/colanic/teichoic acid biosynthesis glycosyltransferase
MAREQPIGPIRGLAARWRQWMSGPLDHTMCLPDICSIEQFQAALAREQARAERNGHQITLALLPAHGRNGDAQRSSRLLCALKGRLRIMDEAGWFNPSRIGVLMPYTSCRGAWYLIEDLCELMDGQLDASDCRVYTYPYDWIDANGDFHEHDVEDTCPAVRIKGPEQWSLFAALCHRGDPGDDSTGAHAASDRIPEGLACVYPLMAVPWSEPSAWQRGLDVACSLLGLVVLAPVFLAAALLIKLVSRGPVFFRQMRIGQGGRPFMLWKFRTMRVNADTSLHQNHVTQLIKGTGSNGEATPRPMTKLDNDPRVIPLGAILRGACIDELPQLINVLRGEMSLVGPRPPIPYEVRDYQPWQRRRLDAVPGLTGLWQVSGKNRLTFDEMARLDIQYSRKKSIWMNIMIMLRTPRVILQEIAEVWLRWKVRAPENA